MTERPNIVYIFTDQQFGGAMGCVGHPDLHTPAMDRLADTGVVFVRAYCTQPLCTPSRASMVTGRMPHEAGTPKNGMSIAEHLRDREMGHLFSAAGYECVYGGKWHIPEASVPDGHGFRRIAPFGDAGLADACTAFLKQQHDRPFLMVASFDNPHNICERARHQRLPWGPIPEPASVDACPDLPANFAIPAHEPDIIRAEQAANFRIYPTVRYTDDDWRRLRHAYFRLVEKVDAEIGRVLGALRDRGPADNTLVVFSSDHGDGHGAHHWNQKCVLYEEPTRVPFIVSLAGATRAGHMDREHLVSAGLDLVPTMCDYAGIDPPEGLAGLSVRPLAEGAEPDTWRDQLVVETTFDGGRGYDTTGRMLRTNRHKYIVYDIGRNREQLFDLQADPGEMHDLSVQAEHRDVLDDHRRRLAEWCRATGDAFRVPGHEHD